MEAKERAVPIQGGATDIINMPIYIPPRANKSIELSFSTRGYKTLKILFKTSGITIKNLIGITLTDNDTGFYIEGQSILPKNWNSTGSVVEGIKTTESNGVLYVYNVEQYDVCILNITVADYAYAYIIALYSLYTK